MSPVSSLWFLVVAAVLGTCALGCAPSGPRIRVASATPAELQAVQDADTVWYEFRKGDEVPFQFLVFGDAESSGQPTKLIAKKDFWLVMTKDQIMISYDGTKANSDEMEFLLSVVPTADGRAQVVWLNHLGTGDAKSELSELLESGAEPAASTSTARNDAAP